MNRRAASASYRVPALLLVAIFFAGAVALDRSGSERSIPVIRARDVVDGPTVPGDDAVSVAWYCSEGTASETGRADETVLIANLSTADIEATITVMQGSEREPVIESRRVEALGQERVEVADLVDAEEPGVVVEILGGPAVVEHELRNGDAVAVGPCAREPSTEWLFAGGTTQRGAEEWLTLFNPFGEDAIVDVTFLTQSGLDAPGATQGVAVSRRSRVSLPVHEHVQRQETVAIAARARVGRVVAERSLVFDGSEGPRGFAVSAGVTGGAARWDIPLGLFQGGITQSVAVANFNRRAATVEVTVTADGDGEGRSQEVDVRARSVARVPIANRGGEGTGYSVAVRTTSGPDVVAEVLSTWSAPSSIIDVASTTGAATRAREWAFATGRLDETGDGLLIAVNVSDRPLTVQLYAYTAGDPDSPRSAPARAVAPGERAVFGMSEIGISPEQVIVVSADGDIVAGRLLVAGGIGFSLGVPELAP